MAPVGAGMGSRRMPRAARRAQLLDVARRVVREDGADALTLGRLAIAAGVSKPVVYDHFARLPNLLIELYRMLDVEKIDAFRRAMAGAAHGVSQTVDLLAEAFIRCAADTEGEVHAIGGALAGAPEKDAVLQELAEHSVVMFVTVLRPHSDLPPADLQRLCRGLVGAGEALATAQVRGLCTSPEAFRAFSTIIAGALRAA